MRQHIIETLIIRGVELGVSLSDFDQITIGFLIDLLQKNHNKNEEEIIEATPEMLDRF